MRLAGWFYFLPWWARLYWLTSAGDARFRLPWPEWLRLRAATAWTKAYMAWKQAGYPQ